MHSAVHTVKSVNAKITINLHLQAQIVTQHY